MRKFILITLLCALVVFGCDDDQPDPEKAQHSPNVPMFADKTATITTNDKFTDKKWNDIVTAIVGKFSEGYNTPPASPGTLELKKASYEEAFNNGITIIVEKNPQGYTNYKAVFSERTLYVHAGGVDNLISDAFVLTIASGKDNIDGVTQP
jgi:hypothetical protein